MKNKYLIFAIILAFLFISPVYAETCDKEEIDRLKSLAEHVDVSYAVMDTFTITYYDEDPITYKDKYKIQLSNLTNEIYGSIKINSYPQKITFEKPILEQVSPGSVDIEIYSSACEKKLKTISLSLPYYNYNYNEEDCKGLDIDVCQEWTLNNISSKKYHEELEKAKQGENKIRETLTDILNNNMTYIIVGVITALIILITTISVINKKRRELK